MRSYFSFPFTILQLHYYCPTLAFLLTFQKNPLRPHTYPSAMFSLQRSLYFSLALTTIVWTCHASNPRIRGRADIASQSTSESSETSNQETYDSSKREHRSLSSSTNSTTCAAISVSGFPSCAAFCEQETGYSLNTFIELAHSSSGNQYCCACFSGDAYCSDDIPECTNYVNLDFGGLSIKWNNSKEDEKQEAQEAEVPETVDVSMNVSCMEANVTDSLACLDFCDMETGANSTSEYRGNAARERYFCVCSNTLVAGENATYCQDNMTDRWKEALSNSTVLPLSTRLGIIP